MRVLSPADRANVPIVVDVFGDLPAHEPSGLRARPLTGPARRLTVEVRAAHTGGHGRLPPMALDLSSLRDALAALNASLRYLDSDLAADPGLRDQFRAAAIQAFEFTYELSFKFMKRQLEQIVSAPTAVDEMTFMQVVRTSAEVGLLDEVSRFFEYREARNITGHSYDKRKAERIVAELPQFALDVHSLLERLEARNHADD